MYVLCILYIYRYIDRYIDICMYIFQRNMLILDIECIYLSYKLHEYKYRYVNIFRIYIYCMCLYLYIHNKYTQNTYIYYVNKNFYSGCD